MKRWLLLPALLLVAAVVLWTGGRAPTAFVLEEECRRYHAERVVALATLQRDLLRAGHPPASDESRRRVAELLDAHKRLEIRGWEVLLLPAGAKRPRGEGFYRAGAFDAAGRDAPPELKGATEVWMAPRSLLARTLAAARLIP